MDLMDAFYFRIMQAVRSLGCGFLLLYFGVQYLRTQNRLRYAVPIRGNSHIDHWLDGVTMFRKVTVMQSDRIRAPVAAGLWKPKIILPKHMDYHNGRYLDFVLEHELVHFAENQNDMGSASFSNFSKNPLEERIVLIMKRKTIGLTSCAAAAVIVVGTAAVFMISPRGVLAEDESFDTAAVQGEDEGYDTVAVQEEDECYNTIVVQREDGYAEERQSDFFVPAGVQAQEPYAVIGNLVRIFEDETDSYLSLKK